MILTPAWPAPSFSGRVKAPDHCGYRTTSHLYIEYQISFTGGVGPGSLSKLCGKPQQTLAGNPIRKSMQQCTVVW